MPAGRHPFYGWYVVGGAFVALLFAYGSMYALGALFTPLSRPFDANRTQTSWLFSISIALGNSLGFLTGPLADRVGPRPLGLLGGVLVGGGLLVASRVETLWQLYAAYCLGVGLGTACILVPATEAVQHFFVRQHGFASGLAVAGIGAGNLAAPPFVAALLRVLDWRDVFLVLGATCLIGIVLASLLLARSPEERGLTPDGDPPTSDATAVIDDNRTLQQALHARPFWLLYGAVAVGSLAAFIPFVHLVPDAESRGIHPVTAATLLGLIGAGSLLGRFTIGAAADRIGRRRSLALAFAIMAATMAWWLVADRVWSLARSPSALAWGMAVSPR